MIQVWDSVTGRFIDSVVVRSPLPDPLVPIVQFVFQQPGWVLAAEITLGAILAVVVLVLAWRRRRAVRTWLVTRPHGVLLAMVGAVSVVLLLILGTGVKTYDYMMHDNDFCRGCHIFVPSGQVFVRPDTGTYLLVNKPEGKHDTLSCHACHPFEIKAQTKELIAWVTARPDEIPPHGKVPREICEQCHVTGPAKDTWKRITTTAGHRTHLESDSSALKDVACLTCHARTAHRFQPADTTCAQQGCHFTDSIRIQLGRMKSRFDPGKPLPNEELLYCNSCHQYTADAQFLAPDSALALLRPGSRQCFKCHEMRTLLATYDPAREPHGGGCGMCHNPHTDVKPADALKSCVDAQCHADWRDVDFHTGSAHRKVAQRCETCHEPHAARVDASDCVGCHKEVRYGPRSRLRLRPPLPFDTTAALRQTSLLEPPRTDRPPGSARGDWSAPPEDDLPGSRTDVSASPADSFPSDIVQALKPISSPQPPRPLVTPGRARGQGAAPPEEERPEPRMQVSVTPSDTFSHDRHRKLACLTCHVLRDDERLTFEPPRGCQICHHQRPARADCGACHQASELEPTLPIQVAVAVPEHDRRRRTVRFPHAKHDTLSCTGCHVSPVTLAPPDSVLTCAGCHDQHHAQSRDCAACHRSAAIREAHKRPVEAHQACDACHTEATVARLVPTRSFCLACHQPEQDHYPAKECSACHFQRSPGELKVQLRQTGRT
ncbi:MAG TPA: hypothetical protein VFT84_14970 [Gemmatimonadales bacterium]|nr:hypothetical protein [Gemmatimonadales bacterium]